MTSLEQKRLLVFADANSIHTEKWIEGFCMENKFEIHLISMNPSGVTESIKQNPRIKTCLIIAPKRIKVNGGNISYIMLLFKILKAILIVKPHIISAHYLTSYGFIAALFKRRSILVQSIYGTDIMVTSQKSFLNIWLTKYSLLRADIISIVNNTMKSKVLQISKIPETKFIVQQYGIASSIFFVKCEKMKTRFISNRNWVDNSNIPSILSAFDKLGQKFELSVAASNANPRHPYYKLCKDIPNVIYLGNLSHEENIAEMAKASYFISYTTSDGASLSLLEAMALECIPIVSDIFANREWITHNRNGFLVPLDDISGLCNCIKKAAAMSREEIHYIKRLNKRFIRKYCSFSKNMKRMNAMMLSSFN